MTIPRPRPRPSAASSRGATLACATLLAGAVAAAGPAATPGGGASPAIGPAPAAAVEAPARAPAPSVPMPIDGGDFGTVSILPPVGDDDIRSVALFLADTDGADLGASVMRERLTQLNTLVVPVDPKDWLATLEPDADGCADLAGDLDALAHAAEASAGVKGWIAPMIVSRGTGSPLAYAALLQSSSAAFKGAVSVDFCPHLATSARLCTGNELEGEPLARGSGTSLDAVSQSPAPWTVLHAASDTSCHGIDVPAFVRGIEGASYVELPDATGRYAANASLMVPFEHAYLAVAGSDSAMTIGAEALPAELRDLPITEIVDPRAKPGDTFAILYSGDGGWAGLDDGVAKALAAAGVPTVGVSSLKYFWKEREPNAMAADFERIATRYAKDWKRSRVVLVGYSFGADAAPFIATRLEKNAGPSLAALGLISPGLEASFQFHVSDWLHIDGAGAPIPPEMAKLDPALPIVCAYGRDEADDSLCTTAAVPTGAARDFDGGHHLGGDYAGIAEDLLAALSVSR